MTFHGYKILYPTPGCCAGEMLFANASQIIRNWFLTLQPDATYQSGHKKGHGCNVST